MKKHLSLQGASVPGDPSATVSSSDSISLGPHNLRPKPSLLPPPEVTRCFLTMADLNTSYTSMQLLQSSALMSTGHHLKLVLPKILETKGQKLLLKPSCCLSSEPVGGIHVLLTFSGE